MVQATDFRTPLHERGSCARLETPTQSSKMHNEMRKEVGKESQVAEAPDTK